MKLITSILIATLFIIFAITGCSQQISNPCNSNTFKYFDVVLDDLKTNGKQSIYFNSLTYADYEAMSYLDLEASYNTLKNINHNFEEEIGQDSSDIAQLILQAQAQNIAIDLNSITDLFCDNENLKSVLGKTSLGSTVYKLDSIVYIKNNKAVFTIGGDYWSKTFLVIYKQKQITLTLLYGITSDPEIPDE